MSAQRIIEFTYAGWLFAHDLPLVEMNRRFLDGLKTFIAELGEGKDTQKKLRTQRMVEEGGLRELDKFIAFLSKDHPYWEKVRFAGNFL